MESSPKRSPRIAVIGAGIGGLAAAAHLARLMPQSSIDILESSDRAGGVILTEQLGAVTLEHAADSFALDLPHIENLHKCLNINPELLRLNQDYRFAQVIHRGKPYPIPTGFAMMQPTRISSILRSPILSSVGKARLVAEQFISARNSDEDESLESFATRRLGREVFERLVQPIVCGIFVAKADELSMQAAMPQYVAMERKYGSLISAARASRKNAPKDDIDRQASGARYDIFAAPVHGMSDWIKQVVEAMPTNVSLRLSHRLVSLKHNNETAKWDLCIDVGSSFHDELCAHYDACIIALNAPTAGTILQSEYPKIATELLEIEYASSAIAAFAIPASEVPEAAKCFGIVVPEIERRNIVAISFSSLKFPSRSPSDVVVARVFMGGATRPDLYEKSDSELEQIAWNETRELLGLAGSCSARWARLIRWPKSMPQYKVGHVDRVKRIETQLSEAPTLKLCGNAYQGVGIAKTIYSGETAAKAIAEQFVL